MDINYELYKVFYFVAKTLSFSEASKCLYISQSAVSQSVKVLEKKLGQTLFIRSTKRVQLTPEGEILFKHIEPAMNLIHKGETQLLEANTLNGGQLRIAASDTICRYFLVPYLNKFHKLYPNVHIKVLHLDRLCPHFREWTGGLHYHQLSKFRSLKHPQCPGDPGIPRCLRCEC